MNIGWMTDDGSAEDLATCSASTQRMRFRLEFEWRLVTTGSSLKLRVGMNSMIVLAKSTSLHLRGSGPYIVFTGSLSLIPPPNLFSLVSKSIINIFEPTDSTSIIISNRLRNVRHWFLLAPMRRPVSQGR